MTLEFKERELVAITVSVAAGCKPCIDYHFKVARKTGSNRPGCSSGLAQGA